MRAREQHTRLCESARAALSATFRERARFPSSPWHAYIGRYGGVVILRDGDPDPVPDDLVVIGRVHNDVSDEQNMVDLRQRLWIATP